MILAPGPFGLGAPELILIVIVIALVFGVGKLADIGGVLGRSIREFRRELREESAPGPGKVLRRVRLGAQGPGRLTRS